MQKPSMNSKYCNFGLQYYTEKGLYIVGYICTSNNQKQWIVRIRGGTILCASYKIQTLAKTMNI